MRENFLWASLASRDMNKHVKSIIRPSMCFGLFLNPHQCFIGTGNIEVNVGGQRIFGPFNKMDYFPELKIAHYYTKSLEEWKQRRSRGKADYGRNNNKELVSLNCFYDSDFHDIECYDVIKCYERHSRN